MIPSKLLAERERTCAHQQSEAHYPTINSPTKRDAKLNSMPFSNLCDVLDKIEATTKRLEINDLLTDFFVKTMQDTEMDKESKCQDLVKIVYLCLSRVLHPLIIFYTTNEPLHASSWDQITRAWSLGSASNS